MRRQSGMTYLEVLGIAIAVLLVCAVIIPGFVGHPHGSPRTSCLNNLKQIGTAMNIYESDWGDTLPVVPKAQRTPTSKAWPGKIMVYARNKRIMRCPVEPDRLTYSFNRRLSGIHESEIGRTADVVVVFESVSDSPLNININGDSVWTPRDKGLPKVGQYIAWPEGVRATRRHWPGWAYPNHEGGGNICFADGHCRYGEVHSRYVPQFSPK